MQKITYKLNSTFVNKLKPQKGDKTYWDSEIKGFGIRVRENSMTWIIMYRNVNGIQKKLTIGKANIITPSEARKLAKEKLTDVIKEKDPANEKQEKRKLMKVSELCDLYLAEGCQNKKESTIKMDISRIERHIKPLLGNIPVANLNTPIMQKTLQNIASGKTSTEKKSKKLRGKIKVTGGQGVANRTIGMFGSILEFAIRYGIIENNPVRGVKKYKDNTKDIFLNLDEIKQLGLALKKAETEAYNRKAIYSTKLLILTGFRKTEILSLKWEYIDLKNQCIRFPDTKTGKQIRPIGIGAISILKEIKNQKNKSEWVFPSETGEKHYIGLPKVFNQICNLINDDGNKFISKEITIHTLRHSFASIGADMGFIDSTVGGIIGHSNNKNSTGRYTHNVDSSLVNASDKISMKIYRTLENEEEINNIVKFKGVK